MAENSTQVQENSAQIKFNDLDIENCFKNFYVVPDYQREYVWTEKEVTQLLLDLYEEFDSNSNKEYFIGTTVVCKIGNSVFELIDGQQRTTTLFIILSSFKKLYSERGLNNSPIETMLKHNRFDAKGKPVNEYRLALQYKDSSGILEKIANNEKRPENLIGSALKLYEAYETIIKFLEDNFKIEKTDDLPSFFMYFYQKVKFIQITSPSINDALKIFETVNDRGIGLNPLDLLKNLIFRQVERNDFDSLKKEWEKIIKLLEKNNEKPLRFLRYFIMANYKINNAKGDEIIREEDIYKWIIENENQVNYESAPFEFVKMLQENAECFVKFYKGNDMWGENVYLNNISKLGGGAFRQQLILFLSARHLSKNLFDHLAKQIENLIFYYFVTGEQTKIFERNFSKWAKSLLTVETKGDLNKFINENIEPEIVAKQGQFKISFLNLSQNSLQQYRLRYILAKLTQYIDLECLGSYSPQNLNTYISKGVEIEHILPDKPKQELIDKYGKEYDGLKIMLGNLTLLEKSINASIGNDFYNLKTPEYQKSRYYLTKSIIAKHTIGQNTAINRINKKLQSFPVWNKESIVARQEMLYNLSKEIWKVEGLS
ncbi:MAG: DUF262 domain-containing protein [Bacteroidia bacterium]